MPPWTWERFWSLQDTLDEEILPGLEDRLQDVVDGRVTPALDDIAIGSARKMRAATLFFDIRGFSQRTNSADLPALKRTLLMLDCVIPMMMHIAYDYGGYVEKNTGDGIMAVIGAELTDVDAANGALDAATEMFYVLDSTVNPALAERGIAPVQARIGLDLGTLLIARIGVPSGTSKHPRNTLTAIGPSANLACWLQQNAGTNQIWCGDLIQRNANMSRKPFFRDVTPPFWTWTWTPDPLKPIYRIWHYDAVRMAPAK